MSTAKKVAIRNIEIVGKENFDAIVAPCAGCGSFLKSYAKLLADQPEWAEKARLFSGKVKDFNEFMTDIGLFAGMGTIKQKVTYHDLPSGITKK
jgi:glycolate oxidase iron-sulfur subunit